MEHRQVGVMIMGGAKVVETEATGPGETDNQATVAPKPAVGPSGEDVLETLGHWWTWSLEAGEEILHSQCQITLLCCIEKVFGGSGLDLRRKFELFLL